MNTLTRFALVGTLTTALDFTLFNGALSLGLGVGPAHAASTSVILPLSFLGQRRAFRSSGRPWSQALRFSLVTIVGAYGVQVGVLAAAVELVGAVAVGPANLAKLAAMSVGIAWNFALFRWFVFRPSGAALADQTSRKAAPSAGDGRANARCAAPVDDGRNLFSR